MADAHENNILGALETNASMACRSLDEISAKAVNVPKHREMVLRQIVL